MVRIVKSKHNVLHNKLFIHFYCSFQVKIFDLIRYTSILVSILLFLSCFCTILKCSNVKTRGLRTLCQLSWFCANPLDAPLCRREARFNMAAPFASRTGRGEQSPNRHYNTYAYFDENDVSVTKTRVKL